MERLESSSIADLMKKCSGCTLRKDARLPVPGEGPKDAKIVFIARNPGKTEDDYCRPLIGRAGQLFNKILLKLNIDRKKVGVMNRASCYSLGDRPPTEEEYIACKENLKNQLDYFDPKLIVPMGVDAVRAFIKKDERMPGITKIAAKVLLKSDSLFVVPLCHPSYYLRNLNVLWDDDFLRFKKIFDGLDIDEKWWKLKKKSII